MKHARGILVVASLLTLTACDAITGLFPGDCTTMPVPAIRIDVVDSITGVTIGSGATVRVRDGSFTYSLVVPTDPTSGAPGPISLGFERAGVYQISVSHPEYRDWSASDVRVTRDRCHVRTAILVARLVHAP
jgi:hypothetical protein